MRAIVARRHGPPEVLEEEERPDPVVEAGHALIGVELAGVNFTDLCTRLGLAPARAMCA